MMERGKRPESAAEKNGVCLCGHRREVHSAPGGGCRMCRCDDYEFSPLLTSIDDERLKAATG